MSNYQSDNEPSPWMWNALMVVVVVIIVGIVYNYRDRIFSDTLTINVGNYDTEVTELGPTSKVIVTLENNTYHARGCEEISGAREKVNYSVALSKRITPCLQCFKDEY